MRAILSSPSIYRLFTRIVGGGRSRYVSEYVRARAGDRILDLGCGPGDILDHLKQAEYVGVDMHQAYLDAARKRYGDRATFIHGKVGTDSFREFSEFDIVLARGLVHHLDDQEAIRFFRLARSSLKGEGRLVTLDGCYVEGQSATARFMISMDRGQYIRTPDQYRGLALTSFSRVETSILHNLIRIPYTHIIMECRA